MKISIYIFSVFLLLLQAPNLKAQELESAETSDASPDKSASQLDSFHQIRLGIDVSKLTLNYFQSTKKAVEFSIDYYHKKEQYYVLEGGWGGSKINYPDLNYQSQNSFLRFGFDKSMYKRKQPRDWGMAFFGLRYGLAFVQRGIASYTTNDGLGNSTQGSIAAKNSTLHWLEFCGGMKLELFPGCFSGWTVRAKILMNQKTMGDLKPLYIAGYGLGEKITAFDYNFYIAYALTWRSKK